MRVAHWRPAACIERDRVSVCSTLRGWTCQKGGTSTRPAPTMPQELWEAGAELHTCNQRTKSIHKNDSKYMRTDSCGGVGSRRRWHRARVEQSQKIISNTFGGKITCKMRDEDSLLWYWRPYILGFRSVTTTPQRSSTSFSFLRSKSRSVVPDAVPVGMIASLTESWIMRVFTRPERPV